MSAFLVTASNQSAINECYTNNECPMCGDPIHEGCCCVMCKIHPSLYPNSNYYRKYLR